MIIGNNNMRPNNVNPPFQNKLNQRKEIQPKTNNYLQNKKEVQHINVTNQKEMTDRSFEILQERLNAGLITMEEFNRKCQNLTRSIKR